MNSNRRIVFLLFLFILTSSLSAQKHQTLSLDDPAYLLLDLGQLKGSISRLSAVKPYPKSSVVTGLTTIIKDTDTFSYYERTILQQYFKRHVDFPNGIRHGNIGAENPPYSFNLGGNFLSAIRGDVVSGNWHLHNEVLAYTLGNIGKNISYYGGFVITLDKVDPEVFVPYSFTKQWDGFHIFFGDKRYSVDGIEPYPYFSYQLQADITASFFHDSLYVRFARIQREWSIGSGALSLSGTARPFTGIDFHLRPVNWFTFNQTLGSLSNRERELDVKNSPEALSFQKMYTLQGIELFPVDWLYFSTFASCIWGKRFELVYMMPFYTLVPAQETIGDFDNLAQEFNIKITVPPIGSLYVSLFADEVDPSNFLELYKTARSMFGMIVGWKAAVPFLPLTRFTFQYSKIEPFTYAHYPENYPFSENPLDMSYTHDGENLGYYLPPNSDEILIKIDSIPLYGLVTSLEYRLIRHGTNDPEIKGDIAIYGDIEQYIRYGEIENYPEKNFLADGMYDWTNAVSLKSSYTFSDLPLSIGAEYSFSYTFWRANDSGMNPPDDKMKHIFALTCSIFK